MATGTIKQVTNNSGSGYCKMPDGTLIQCKQVVVPNVTCNTAWGSLYETPLVDLGDWNIPFIETPIVSITPINNGAMLELIKGMTATHIGSGYFARAVSTASVSIAVHAIGIGRWK